MYSQITANKRKTWLLMLLFVIFILLTGSFVGRLTGYGYAGLVIAAIFSIIMTAVSYYSSDKIALWSAGAVKIQKEDNPYVYRMVENLCIASGLSVPQVHIIDDPSLNAFATGRDPGHASIALTTGIIKRLENEELEGVIAHELSHIKNYDIRLTTIIIGLIGVISILSDFALRHLFWNGGDRENRNSHPFLMILGIILLIFAPLIAQLIQLAISRKREFLADASGALLTRYPQGLSNALKKISLYKEPMAKASTATAHLFFANPFGGAKSLANLFSTHPPIEQRIKALEEMTL
ncbi:MAG: M48 family metalloprotease [Parcubacteria group bacterium]|nr:M48 family metalloprotease [Parcubacteria group bacterium]